MTGDALKVLFLHRNSRGQFQFLGAWLAEHGWDVTFAMGGTGPDREEGGMRLRYFRARHAECPPTDFRHALDFAAQNAAAAADWMMAERDRDGYEPDIVMAHVGWGVGLCVKQIWPDCVYVAYHEWYYTDQNWDEGGRIERPADMPALVSNRLRNLPIAAEFDTADANWCPTRFQASRFPPALRRRLRVIPDGVDCATFAPAKGHQPPLPGLDIPPEAPVVTYATRGMEPVRGFPQFIRALALLHARRPDLHALIVGDDRVAYGRPLPDGETWGKRMLDRHAVDRARTHVRPLMPRDAYARVLQASTAHVYFTEPFVTSWSLLDALSTGCLVIGSLTGPVEEFVTDMETGILVDMDDPEEVADMVEWVIDHPDEVALIRAEARRRIRTRFDMRRIFPRKEKALRRLLARV